MGVISGIVWCLVVCYDYGWFVVFGLEYCEYMEIDCVVVGMVFQIDCLLCKIVVMQVDMVEFCIVCINWQCIQRSFVVLCLYVLLQGQFFFGVMCLLLVQCNIGGGYEQCGVKWDEVKNELGWY